MGEHGVFVDASHPTRDETFIEVLLGEEQYERGG
jgi:hypothetical protein